MEYVNYSKAGIKAAKEAIEKYCLDTDSLITYSNVVLGINLNKGGKEIIQNLKISPLKRLESQS